MTLCPSTRFNFEELIWKIYLQISINIVKGILLKKRTVWYFLKEARKIAHGWRKLSAVPKFGKICSREEEHVPRF